MNFKIKNFTSFNNINIRIFPQILKLINYIVRLRKKRERYKTNE